MILLFIIESSFSLICSGLTPFQQYFNYITMTRTSDFPEGPSTSSQTLQMLYYCFNPFPHTDAFWCLSSRQTTFEHCGKRSLNAHDEQFLLLPHIAFNSIHWSYFHSQRFSIILHICVQSHPLQINCMWERLKVICSQFSEHCTNRAKCLMTIFRAISEAPW